MNRAEQHENNDERIDREIMLFSYKEFYQSLIEANYKRQKSKKNARILRPDISSHIHAFPD